MALGRYIEDEIKQTKNNQYRTTSRASEHRSVLKTMLRRDARRKAKVAFSLAVHRGEYDTDGTSNGFSVSGMTRRNNPDFRRWDDFRDARDWLDERSDLDWDAYLRGQSGDADSEPYGYDDGYGAISHYDGDDRYDSFAPDPWDDDPFFGDRVSRSALVLPDDSWFDPYAQWPDAANEENLDWDTHHLVAPSEPSFFEQWLMTSNREVGLAMLGGRQPAAEKSKSRDKGRRNAIFRKAA